MIETDIARIEATLGLTLPVSYRTYLAEDDQVIEEHGPIDDVTALRDADQIIEATLDYRHGFEGLPSWPAQWLYMGDEADACPYALDCQTGRLIRTDKGHLNRPPLTEYPSFESFLQKQKQEQEEQLLRPPVKETWGDRFRDNLPVMIGLFGIFVVLPLIGLTIKLLYLWITTGEFPKFEA